MKKQFKFVAVWIAVFCLCSMLIPTTALASDGNDSGIVDAGHNKDVFISVDADMLARLSDSGTSLTSDDIAQQLKNYLVENHGDLYNDVNIRIRSNAVTVDTTKLENWYVYDHYDIQPADAWSPEDERFGEMRPYFAARDLSANNKLNSKSVRITTIQELMEYGYHILDYNVEPLREHIYSYTDDANKNHMVFMGYGSNRPTGMSSGYANYLTDFLFYPTQQKDKKNIVFDIDSSLVKPHSLDGAGFLFNTGIDAQGNIHGYVLYLTFTPANSTGTATGASMHLYKINDGVNASAFHSSTGTRLATSYMTRIGTATTSTFRFTQHMNLNISFDDDSFSVIVTSLNAPDGQEIAFNYASGEPTSYATGYYGFGPIVGYTGQSHNCARTSVYAFSNLEMFFATDVFRSLREVEFNNSQNTDRYFINLTSQSVDESNSDFWDGIARLRNNEIYYLSNQENDVIGENGKNGDNGLMLTSETLEGLIAEIGEYIADSTNSWQGDGLPELELAEPVAVFSLLGNDSALGDEFRVLNRVEQQMLDTTPVTVYLQDQSSVSPSDGNPDAYIDKLEVVITYPDGTKETQNIDVSESTNRYNILLLDDDAPIGTYNVQLVSIDNMGNRSDPISRTFEVIQDTNDPVVAIAAKDQDLLVDDVYEGESVTLILSDNLDNDWGIQRYQIGYSDEPDDAENAEYGEVQRLADLWPNYPLEIDGFESGVQYLYVKAWDWVGNETVYELEINPRVNTVEFSETNTLGLDLSDVTFGPDENLYIIGETAYPPEPQQSQAVDGYSLIGYTTDPDGTEPMESFTIEDEVTTLYPLYRDTTPPTISPDTSFSSGAYLTDLTIPVTAADNDEVDELLYFVAEFGKSDTIPDDMSAEEFEELADGGWISVEDDAVEIEEEDLTSGKRYLVLFKATDASGNTGYGIVTDFQYDSDAPDLILGGESLSDGKENFLTTALNFEDPSADDEELTVTYIKNDSDTPVTVDSFPLVLTPPETGTDTYVITVTDGAGNSTSKTIKLKSVDDLLDLLDEIDEDTVTTQDAETLEEILAALEEILENERAQDGDDGSATGATDEQITRIQNALSDVQTLGGIVEEIQNTLDDTQQKLEDCSFDTAEPEDVEELEELIEQIEGVLEELGDNLTEDEKEALEAALERLAGLVEFIEKNELLEEILDQKVTLDDGDTLDEIIAQLEELLEREDLSEEEEEALSGRLDEAREQRQIIENVLDFLDEFEEIMGLPTGDLQQSGYEQVVEMFEIWSELTDEEKLLIGEDAEGVTELKQRIEELYLKATETRRVNSKVELRSGATGAVVSGLDNLDGNMELLTEEEIELVRSGGRVLFKLTVDFREAGLYDLTAPQRGILDSVMTENDAVAGRLQLTMTKYVLDSDGETVSTEILTEMPEKIRVEFTLTAWQQRLGNKRLYLLDGTAVSYANRSSRSQSFTIETNKVGVYALLYDEPANAVGGGAVDGSGVTTVNSVKDGAQTGDSRDIVGVTVLAAVSLALIAADVIRRRRSGRRG